MNWQKLGELLSAQTGVHCRDLQVSPVSGGDINRAFRLDDGERRYFVKVNRSDRLTMFNAEQAGLEAIHDCGVIRVPRVYATGCIDDEAFIAMEYIEFGGAVDEQQFAGALAAMHHCTRPEFGFHCDNTIGSNPQPNAATASWIEFWSQQRLGQQLDLARENGLDPDLVDCGMRLEQKLDRFFGDYQPRASLLHGDLWTGNYAADSNGQAVIYDPACYYGDHEADLAMMELFGHPGKRFFETYHAAFRIDDGYPLRRDLYNLYHLLNHANLFGGGYPAQALQMTHRLLSAV